MVEEPLNTHRMPHPRKSEVIEYFKRSNRDLVVLQGWTADDLADLIGSVDWKHQAEPGVQDAVQNLYEQRRTEEAEQRAAPAQARMIRLNAWSLVFVIVGTFLAGIGAALAGLMAWKQFHP